MKEKIMYLIVGALIGAIITAACFMAFNKNDSSNSMEGGPGQMQMEGNPPSGEKPEGEPPAKPGEESSNTNNETSENKTEKTTENQAE